MGDLFDLTGKNVLITGGTGHLGSAMCEGLAAYGANVILTSTDYDRANRAAESLSDTYRTSCSGIKLDFTYPGDIEQGVNRIVSEFGSIDVLVNNACLGTMGFLEDFDNETWDIGIDGSINGVFRLTQKVLSQMKTQKKGSIINIASMYGMIAPNPALYQGDVTLNNPANYGAGKAAIIQFTRYVAAYYAKYGIRSNSISPGSFPNPAVQQNKEFVGRLSEKSMLGRIGQPDELKGILVLLASDASSYITGQNICVDGGWTAW
ncbi:MAG: SDR family oxidoreductase [Eubacteriales bacterium]|nr:SDR family oxidoreductase [Eubacteriales bacterium]